jgi:diguanylate cyclase (GGDEF)-like protein/PAS domain S-box-containing protein
LERLLFETEAKYRTLLEQLPAAIYVDEPDVQGKTLYVSPQIQELLGITPEEYINRANVWDELVHPDDRARLMAEYDEFIRTGQPENGDYRFLRPDGTVVWVHDRSKLVVDEDGEPMFVQGVMFDITAQKEAESRLAYLAYHDALTDLPNRVMFSEHLDLALARGRRRELSVAILFLDLDGFKQANDEFGHALGDEVLKVVAQRVGRSTRATDLVSRQGGDEFLVLMADLERGPAGSIARQAVDVVIDRIEDALGEPLIIAGLEVSTSASIGTAIYPADGEDPRELLIRADVSMYAQKRDRRLAG